VARRAERGWEIRARRVPVVRSLAAAAALAVAGALLGGPVGWLGFLFFSVVSVALIVQLVGRRPVAAFEARGVTVATGAERAHLVAWDDVEAILLWTRRPRTGSRVDMLSVVTTRDLPGLAVSLTRTDGIDVASRSGYARVDPERTLAVATPLLDCRVDAYELRAVLLNYSSRVVVVDRRL
jgi:hypothetical protein